MCARALVCACAAFKEGDYQTMGECYAPDARFSDPVFQNLDAKRVRAMWAMLLRGGKDPDNRSFRDVKADQKSGQAHWEAKYPSPSNPKRQVHNKIDARFEFAPDGRILRHDDSFDLTAWAKMALGGPAYLLGCCGCFQSRIRQGANAKLDKFISTRPEFQ